MCVCMCACMCVCSYVMSVGRWDSSPDSRSMPTVDLQWWLSSTDVFCSRRGEMCFSQTEQQAHADPPTNTQQHTRVYLVEGCQVVSGFDEEGLVDPRMVHIVSSCCHQPQEHVQRTQLLCQLQHTDDSQHKCFLCTHSTLIQASFHCLPV